MTKPSLTLMATRNLTRNRFRSVLACAGIAIGVFAIASLGIFGNVLSVEASQSIGEIGSEVIVTPNEEEGFSSLAERDVEEIERVTSGVPSTAIITEGGLAVSGGETTTATYYGTNSPDSIFEAEEGNIEAYRSGALVGAGVAESLGLRVGDRVETEIGSYRVVALLEQQDSGITPVGPDEAIILPESELGVSDGYDQVIVRAGSGAEASRVADEIRERVNDRVERVDVFELSSIVEEIDEFFSLLSGFLLGLGGISLIVAGVSILNVMMMSVVERRGEIGVMRAVGGQRGDVMRIILVEALLLGFFGSVVGVALTSVAVAGLYFLTPVSATAVLNTGTVFYLGLALGVGVTVSVLSGVYPAWSAANEDPVEAIRS